MVHRRTEETKRETKYLMILASDSIKGITLSPSVRNYFIFTFFSNDSYHTHHERKKSHR